jgi:LAO/AO transport system kinase
MRPPPADLAALAAGGKAALARSLTALESAPEDQRLLALLDGAWRAPRGVAIGLTGPPGVGKSTLTNALIGGFRAADQTVGVIAVDPSSRLSGGALLGDRARIDSDPADQGVFVRSMAARGRLGGLADLTFPATVLMRACFDWVLVETVGVGQSETEITDCADLVVGCVQPGSGDSLQFMKAGVMEVPDVVLVTKGDIGAAARRAAAEARGALSLASAAAPPVAIVSARTGDGIAAAIGLIAARAGTLRGDGGLARRRRGQGRAWAESRLVESLGSVGRSALAPRLDVDESPFAGLAGLLERARDLVHKSLKDL